MPNLSALSSRSGIPEPALEEIIAAGEKYARRVVLYGSRARGDHHSKSDMDIAFFGDENKFLAFQDAMEALPTLLELDVIHVTENSSAAFVKNIRKDGIVLMDESFKKTVQLSSALKRLEEAIAEYRQTGSKAVRDGALQRFEFCAELAWKAVHDYLEGQGYLDVHSPKAIMRKAYVENLITDEQGWIHLLNARNQTSHLYDDEMADSVYQAVETIYLPLLNDLSQQLNAAME